MLWLLLLHPWQCLAVEVIRVLNLLGAFLAPGDMVSVQSKWAFENKAVVALASCISLSLSLSVCVCVFVCAYFVLSKIASHGHQREVRSRVVAPFWCKSKC